MRKLAFMQPETEEFMVEVEAHVIQERRPRSFELFEEYSQRTIADTIRICRENFEKADVEARRELLKEVEREVNDFRAWLEETKDFESTTTHYYSVSMKSLLLGLPVGVQVARLFDAILDI
jgi:hypothetical protein